jgi:hypothetical protein
MLAETQSKDRYFYLNVTSRPTSRTSPKVPLPVPQGVTIPKSKRNMAKGDDSAGTNVLPSLQVICYTTTTT